MSESHYVYAAIGVLLTTVLITSGCEPSAPEGETAPASEEAQSPTKTEKQTDKASEHGEAHVEKPRRIHLTPEQREQLPIFWICEVRGGRIFGLAPASSIPSFFFVRMQCNAMQYNTLQYNAMQCNAMQCNGTAQR